MTIFILYDKLYLVVKMRNRSELREIAMKVLYQIYILTKANLDYDIDKLIKYLDSRCRISCRRDNYIYFYDGYYYIFLKYPVTDERALPPITISKDRAEEIMAATP